VGEWVMFIVGHGLLALGLWCFAVLVAKIMRVL
jgi:hypothetical protein